MSESTPVEHIEFCGIVKQYSFRDARWFAINGFVPMITGIIGMLFSNTVYFGLSFDIGLFFSLDSFILSESILLIPLYLIASMLFFAGGIEWFVLCRHCPCYEYSGKQHGNEDRFYCLANWGSPKIFDYKPGDISRLGQAAFVIGVSFAYLFPILYMLSRLDILFIQLIIVGSFVVNLRYTGCSSCPNFGCILNSVPEKKRIEFNKALDSGELYSD